MALGQGDSERAQSTVFRLVQLSVCSGLVLAFVSCGFAEQMCLVFTSDANVVGTAASTLRLIALFYPLEAAMTVMDGVLIGARDTAYVHNSKTEFCIFRR